MVSHRYRSQTEAGVRIHTRHSCEQTLPRSSPPTSRQAVSGRGIRG
jgi:hypothetical protein